MPIADDPLVTVTLTNPLTAAQAEALGMPDGGGDLAVGTEIDVFESVARVVVRAGYGVLNDSGDEPDYVVLANLVYPAGTAGTPPLIISPSVLPPLNPAIGTIWVVAD